MCTEPAVAMTMVRRGKLIRSNLAAVAAVACAVTVTVAVPALAAPGRTARPGSLTTGYRVVATIKLGADPDGVVQDPLTGTTYVAEEGEGVFSTAVINDHTDKVVARLPFFGVLALDSRTDTIYMPVGDGSAVAVIAGRTHRVTKIVRVAAVGAAVDPRTGRVFLGAQTSTGSSLVVLSDRTNKIIDRIPVPDSAAISGIAASPARGVIYVGISPLSQDNSVWVVGAKSAKVLAKIHFSGDMLGFGVDDQNNLLGVMDESSLTVIDGKTHQARAPVNVLEGTPEAGARALAVSPQTHTMYVGVECDPDSWVAVVSEQTRRIVATIYSSANANVSDYESLSVDGQRHVVFAVNYASDDVTIINARTNKVLATPAVGKQPVSVAVNRATGRAYVANFLSQTISVLAPTGASAQRITGSARDTSRVTVGHALGQRRGVCG
jgi:YVTN family beta-propeller protein